MTKKTTTKKAETKTKKKAAPAAKKAPTAKKKAAPAAAAAPSRAAKARQAASSKRGISARAAATATAASSPSAPPAARAATKATTREVKLHPVETNILRLIVKNERPDGGLTLSDVVEKVKLAPKDLDAAQARNIATYRLQRLTTGGMARVLGRGRRYAFYGATARGRAHVANL